VKPSQQSPQPRRTEICCDIVAHRSLCLTAESLPPARQRPGPAVGVTLPPNLLKHADEQTVAGLGAVLHAIADFRLDPTSFRDWGIVAAPCFLGRITLANALESFAAEGPWGLSPHFIPHRSQHAVAGTISLALKIHGPNFGAGGGPTSPFEGILGGAVLLSEHRLPGAWVVITGWEPELIPVATSGKDGIQWSPPPHSICMALALAITSHNADSLKPRIRVQMGVDREPECCKDIEPTLSDIIKAVDRASATGPYVALPSAWRCHGGGWIEIQSGSRVCALHPPHSLRRLSEASAVTGKGAETEKKR
jgi:hypothetical protein